MGGTIRHRTYAKRQASFLKKEAKMFLTWTVLISWPPARLSKVFAPLFSKSGFVLAALQTE
jgi:hypothetical protein